MPPKVKVTKEDIISAAVDIVRKSGAQAINARTVACALNCSTQPVLYYFSTVEDIKKMVYKKADAYHSDYIMNTEIACGNPMLAIGMNYIKFAIEERNLFRLLFQSDEFSGGRTGSLASVKPRPRTSLTWETVMKASGSML